MKKNRNMKIMIPALLGVLALVVLLKSLGILTFRSGMRIGFSGSNGIHCHDVRPLFPDKNHLGTAVSFSDVI